MKKKQEVKPDFKKEPQVYCYECLEVFPRSELEEHLKKHRKLKRLQGAKK